jgi:hypothetical protein
MKRYICIIYLLIVSFCNAQVDTSFVLNFGKIKWYIDIIPNDTIVSVFYPHIDSVIEDTYDSVTIYDNGVGLYFDNLTYEYVNWFFLDGDTIIKRGLLDVKPIMLSFCDTIIDLRRIKKFFPDSLKERKCVDYNEEYFGCSMLINNIDSCDVYFGTKYLSTIKDIVLALEKIRLDNLDNLKYVETKTRKGCKIIVTPKDWDLLPEEYRKYKDIEGD